MAAVGYVLLALTMALVAAAPFLTRPGLPRATDAELHVYRAAELGHTLRGGAFYPRWAPDLYYGYGYPIFNYYAPLTYYLANLFALLPGVGIVAGVKGVFVLGLILASVGIYLLGRELFGPGAGVLAAACYTFAPYIVLIDPHARGDLAEHFAVCLIPLTFYAFTRLVSGVGGRGALLGSVLALAATVFSHNLLGLVTGGLLLVYWLWTAAATVRPRVGRDAGRRLGWGALSFVLSATLIAFFWLPAWLELDAVKLQVVGQGHFDFRGHFLSLAELLAPSPVLDLGAAAPRYRFNLGLAQWLLALPAVGVLLRWGVRRMRGLPPEHRPRPRARVALWYFVLAGLGLVFLMLPLSRFVWERIPGMAYLQFPWRLLAPANAMLAVCAAGGTTLLPAGRGRNPALATLVILVLLLALPALYPPMWAPEFGPTAPGDIIRWEMESRGVALGTTSTGDFVPVGAAMAPMYPQGSLVESYWYGDTVDRVNRATLPQGARVAIVEHGPLHDRFAVSTPTAFVLRLFTFYFPGWRATVDGEEVEIEVAGPEGFITFWVPEGEHEVEVRFGDTPPRTAGWIVSALGLAGLAIALVRMRPSSISVHRSSSSSSRPALRPLAWLSGGVLLFVVLKSAVIDPRDNWMRYTSPPGQAWAAQHERRAIFVDGGGRVELLGYDLPRSRVPSGGALPLVLYWRAVTPLSVNYQSFVHLAQPLHIVWGQEDHLNPGGLPTRRWPLSKYIWDAYEIRVLPGTPPGTYVLNVGLYSMVDGYRLQHYAESGQVTGDSAIIATVEVERPRRQPTPAALDMTGEVMVTFPEGGVTLLGYAQPQARMALPGGWPVTLFWRADRDRPAARVRDLVLVDAEGQEAARLSGAPGEGVYPFDFWRAGEVVRDPLLLVVPHAADVEPGRYRFGVVLSADVPLRPEGRDDDFVPLGAVEFFAQP